MSSQVLGNILDKLGTALNAKERGWSERLAQGPTTNTGVTSQSKAAGLDDWKQMNYDVPAQGGYMADVKGYPVGINPAPETNNGSSGGDSGGGGFDRMDKNANVDQSKYWWDAAHGWKPRDSGSSKSNTINGEDAEQWNRAYSGLFDEYNRQETQARKGAEESKGNVLSRAEAEAKKYETELDKMLRDIGVNKETFNKSIVDALAQNVEGYNALEQRANVRYGGGSSLGDLMRELASKEYYKQQGSTRTQNAAGQAQFANEIADAKTFVSQKLSDLDLWKNEALTSIEQNLASVISGISSNRAQTEAQKATAKINALQQAQAQAANIAQADTQMRQELAMAYIANVQELEQRVMTPQEIQSVLSNFANIDFVPQDQTGTSMDYNYGAMNNEEDEISKLMPAIS